MSGPVLTPDPVQIERRRQQAAAAGPVDTRDAPGIIDLIPEQFRVAEDELASVQQDRLREKYYPVVEALMERGYDRGALFDSLDVGSGRTLEGEGEYNRVAIWQFIRRERDAARRAGKPEPFPTLPQDRQTFEQPELTRFGARGRDQTEIARAPGGTQFVSGLIGGGALEMTRPLNIATLPIGGFGKSIAMKVLTQGLTQAGITAIGLPEQIVGREAMGEQYTVAEAAMNIGGAALGGAVLEGVGQGVRVGLPKLIDKLDPNAEAKAYARAFEQMVPAHLRTPEQDAALFVLRRAGEVEDVNPYVRTHEGIDAHTAKMEAALRALEEGRIAAPAELTGAASPIPAPSPVARPVSGGPVDFGSVKAAIAGPESGGDDFATNRMGSSAAGRYQFIEDTFVGLYARVFRVSAAEAERAWNSNRKFDVSVQEALMDRLLADNAAALERAGIAADPGNLYLAHFAGAGKAIELLRAPREARVADFFSARAIRQNPTYLGGGKTVGEAIDIIRGKVGDPGQRSPAPIDPALLEPELRNPDLDAERPATPLIDEKAADAALPEPVQSLIDPLRDIVTGTRLSLNRTGELAAELGTDETTLREALTALVERGDITQNRATGKFMRKAAVPVTAANQRRPRTLLEFLAERSGLNDWGGDLASRGIKPGTRKVGAKVIRNARREDGTVISGEGEWGLDRAFQSAREEGYFPEFEGRTEDTYGDALDEVALLLQAIDEELAGSPRYRMDDWDRLAEFKLTGSTEGIYGGRLGPEDADPDDFGPYAELVEKFREEWSAFGNDPRALEDFDEAYGGQGRAQPQGGASDRPGQASPAELDAAAAAKPRSDHTDLPPDPDPRFDEPDGPGIVAAAESAWHDIRVAGEADPNIAARQRQEAQLGAEAPMRATADQDGTMGLGLFDAVDQRSLFDLGDGRGERTVADIRAELDADKAAIETMRSCLT